jgi:hypothetical protein
MSDNERLETQQECDSGERQRHQLQQQQRLLQVKYLEGEVRNLQKENLDLNTSLRIHKQTILECMRTDCFDT